MAQATRVHGAPADGARLRKYSAPAVGDAARVHEEARDDDTEEKAADVGQVGDAAGARLGDDANVEDLHEKPEADQERGGNQRDPEKDEEEEKVRMRSRGKVMRNAPMTAAMAPLAPRVGMREKGSPRICADHGDDAADEIEDGEAKLPMASSISRPKAHR